jgi:hypothetical protein
MDIWEPEHLNHNHDLDVHKLIKCRADTLQRLKMGLVLLKRTSEHQEYVTTLSVECEYETLIKLLEGDLEC